MGIISNRIKKNKEENHENGNSEGIIQQRIRKMEAEGFDLNAPIGVGKEKQSNLKNNMDTIKKMNDIISFLPNKAKKDFDVGLEAFNRRSNAFTPKVTKNTIYDNMANKSQVQSDEQTYIPISQKNVYKPLSARNNSDNNDNSLLENLANMSRADRNNQIKGLTKDKKEQSKLNLQVEEFIGNKKSQEEADRINQDLKEAPAFPFVLKYNPVEGPIQLPIKLHSKYDSAMAHILKGIPIEAKNATVKTTTAMASLLPEPNKSVSGMSTNDMLNASKVVTKQYQQINDKIDNEVVRTASSVSGTIGQMVPSILANLAMPGSGNVVNAVNVASSEYQEALNDDNTNRGQAFMTGALKGGASYGIEKMTGGNFLSKGSLDDLAKKTIASKTSSDFSKKVASKIYEVGGEVLEENLGNQVGYVIDKVINNKDITAEQWVSDISETSKNTVLTTVVLNLLGLGGSTYKEIKQQENDAKVQKIIDEAEKVIRDENLRIDNTNRLEKRQDLATKNMDKVSNLVNQIQEFQKIYSETKEPALQATIQYQIESLQEQLNSINKNSIIEQTINQNEENLLTNKQVNSQENKIAQNGNIEQVKTNIIDKKIKEYISQEKENFTTNININTKVVSNTDEVLINYKNTKEATVFKKAKTVFKSLGRNVFKNGNQDIYVDNSDIKESIHHTLKDNYQKSLLNENLAVYSKLGEVIESAVKISDSNEMKNRKQYSDWEYYVSKVNIDSKPYIVEFDTTMKDGNRHFRLERVYELNKADVTTDSSSNLTPRFECNICFY